MRVVEAVFVLLVASGLGAQEHYVSYLQQDVLVRIAGCTTAACVKEAVAGAPYSDPPLRLIAASALHQLNPGAARQELVAAIPVDPVAFWFCYAVTMPSLDKKRFQRVSDLYDLYFAAAASAAQTEAEIRRFLLMASFSDGEVAETVMEDVSNIQKRSPSLYCGALATLHASVTRYLPECEPRRRDRKK